jgi:hypothetical protein
MHSTVKQPLTNVQLELLKTFSHKLSDRELIELRKTLALFFGQRLVEEADKPWEEKKWTDQDVDAMLCY